MNITFVDLNGKPVDWTKTKLPDDLAERCIRLAERRDEDAGRRTE